jgi:hypothetical protein
VLGIVSDEYELVDNIDAFRFLDALIGSEMHFETAGGLWGGRSATRRRACDPSDPIRALSCG